MELEILAILTAIFTVRAGSKINLFTDNLGVCQVWNKLFEIDTLTWLIRRIWNIKFIALWKLLYKFIKDNNLSVSIFKVKVIRTM
jgi:hypothetical protein